MVPPTFIQPPIALPSSSSSGASNITNSVDGGLVAGQLPEKKKKEKKKTVVRVAGSNVWEDESLLDWDPSIFVIIFALKKFSLFLNYFFLTFLLKIFIEIFFLSFFM